MRLVKSAAKLQVSGKTKGAILDGRRWQAQVGGTLTMLEHRFSPYVLLLQLERSAREVKTQIEASREQGYTAPFSAEARALETAANVQALRDAAALLTPGQDRAVML